VGMSVMLTIFAHRSLYGHGLARVTRPKELVSLFDRCRLCRAVVRVAESYSSAAILRWYAQPQHRADGSRDGHASRGKREARPGQQRAQVAGVTNHAVGPLSMTTRSSSVRRVRE
jgi:hypothetical protein